MIMIISQSTWLQLDISPCSYQSYSVTVLILLCLAVLFFTATRCFCLAYHTFLQYSKKLSSQLDVHATGDLMLIAVNQKDRALERTYSLYIMKFTALQFRDKLQSPPIYHTYESYA